MNLKDKVKELKTEVADLHVTIEAQRDEVARLLKLYQEYFDKSKALEDSLRYIKASHTETVGALELELMDAESKYNEAVSMFADLLRELRIE